MTNHKTIIDKIKKKIVASVRPQQIILFGSMANDTPSKDSDIDLLIVKESNVRRDKRDREIRKVLKDIIYPMDIFVYTPKEVSQFKDQPGSFLKKIIDTGKVLYERN